MSEANARKSRHFSSSNWSILLLKINPRIIIPYTIFNVRPIISTCSNPTDDRISIDRNI